VKKTGKAVMRLGGRESMSATMFSLPAICRISKVNSATWTRAAMRRRDVMWLMGKRRRGSALAMSRRTLESLKSDEA
jgi:hypothetical protein